MTVWIPRRSGKVTCPYITPPAIMEEYGYTKHNDNNDKKIDTGMDTLDK